MDRKGSFGVTRSSGYGFGCQISFLILHIPLLATHDAAHERAVIQMISDDALVLPLARRSFGLGVVGVAGLGFVGVHG